MKEGMGKGDVVLLCWEELGMGRTGMSRAKERLVCKDGKVLNCLVFSAQYMAKG